MRFTDGFFGRFFWKVIFLCLKFSMSFVAQKYIASFTRSSIFTRGLKIISCCLQVKTIILKSKHTINIVKGLCYFALLDAVSSLDPKETANLTSNLKSMEQTVYGKPTVTSTVTYHIWYLYQHYIHGRSLPRSEWKTLKITQCSLCSL